MIEDPVTTMASRPTRRATRRAIGIERPSDADVALMPGFVRRGSRPIAGPRGYLGVASRAIPTTVDSRREVKA